MCSFIFKNGSLTVDMVIVCIYPTWMFVSAYLSVTESNSFVFTFGNMQDLIISAAENQKDTYSVMIHSGMGDPYSVLLSFHKVNGLLGSCKTGLSPPVF